MSASAPSGPRARASTRAIEGWLRSLAAPVRPALALAIGCGVGGGVLLVAQVWLMAGVIADAVVGGATLPSLWPRLWTLLAVFAGRAALAAVGDIAAFEAGARVVLALRERLQAHLVALGPAWMREQRTGELVTAFVDRAETLGGYFSAYLPQVVLAVAVPLAILVGVVGVDWVSALILVLTAPLIPLFMILIGRGAERLNRRQWHKLAWLGAHVFDAIEGLATLKLFGAARREIARVDALSQDYRDATMAVLRVAFLSSLALEFFATLGVATVAVYVGFRLYGRHLDLDRGLFALLLAPEFYRPLRAMGTQYHARMEALGAAEGIVAVLRTPPPRADRPPGRALPPIAVATVRFEGVGFAYAAEPTVRDLDFTLQRGRRVALVGPTGAGKSTVGQLLLGFLAPDEGRILVDGIDLRDLDPAGWMARVAWLPQRPTLFHGTVRDNILLGRADADEAAVARAVAAAGADTFIAGLPRGDATMLGEHGQGLSGGEVQRIALARVFLKEADVVLIDEAAAGLDEASAAHITASVARLAPRCATLIVAHRLETIRGADEILVLDGGRIVERGRHDDLLARGGLYARLVETGMAADAEVGADVPA